jgi:hypothetical protein
MTEVTPSRWLRHIRLLLGCRFFHDIGGRSVVTDYVEDSRLWRWWLGRLRRAEGLLVIERPDGTGRLAPDVAARPPLLAVTHEASRAGVPW